MKYPHYPGYLKLSRQNGDITPIVSYQVDENGNPILDPNKILLIKVRVMGSKITIAFDSMNDYKIMRYEVLEENPEDFGGLKEVVDKKESDLENKVRKAG